MGSEAEKLAKMPIEEALKYLAKKIQNLEERLEYIEKNVLELPLSHRRIVLE